MIRTSVGIFSVLGLLACSSDAPPGAAVAKDVNLTDSALARLSNVTFLRAGDGFTLAGYDAGQVRWGRISLDGVLAEQPAFALPVTPVGPAPVFAATKRAIPGDQVVAIAVRSSATAGAYDLVAVVQTVDAPTPPTPVVLATLPVGTNLANVQIAAGAATTGNVGFVAWGIQSVKGRDVEYLLLPADAAVSGAPGKLFNTDPSSIPLWDCLQTTNGHTGLGFSVISANAGVPQYSDFQTGEINEAGELTGLTYEFNAAVTNCRIVGSPGSNGNYVMAFDSNAGIDAAMFNPVRVDSGTSGGGSVLTINPLLSNASFGGPLDKPIPAWVSSPGGDFSVGLQRAGGPQVVRYEYNGMPHGAAVTLRSDHGATGPVAAWVDSNSGSAYVTYTDDVNGTSGTSTKRYFIRVDSPATLP